jgi:hypothetical protein
MHGYLNMVNWKGCDVANARYCRIVLLWPLDCAIRRNMAAATAVHEAALNE